MQFESQGFIHITGNSEYVLYNNVFESRSYINVTSYQYYSVYWIFDSIVNINLSSNIPAKVQFYHIGSGSIGSFGSSTYYISDYIARGGIKLSSTNLRSYNASLNFDLQSQFIAYGTGDPDFNLSFDSQWNINSNNYYWYRVFACSRHSSEYENEDAIYSNEVFDEKFKDPKCGYGKVSMLTAIAARSVDEVCSILKNPKLGPSVDFKLISIKRYVDPIIGSGVRSLLVEEEFCNSPSCLDFCLDFDFTKENTTNIQFEMSVVFDIFYHEFIGGLSLSGGAQTLYLDQLGSGFISLSGSANFSSPIFSINSDVELSLQSQIEFYINPFIRNFDGSIQISGAIQDFISPKYFYEPSVILQIDSNTNILFIVNQESIAVLEVDGSAELNTDQNFIYDPEGFIVIDSSLENLESTYYNYQSSGSFSTAGNAELLSSAWGYTGSGSIYIFNNSFKIGRCYNSIAFLNTGGSASANSNSAFNFSGSIELHGSAEIVSPNRIYNSIGDSIDLEGIADLNFTNFGLLVANANLRFSYLNLQIDSEITANQQNQSNLSINSGVVTVCGCSSSLNLALDHNLQFTGVFSKFLVRNPLVNFENNFLLRYKSSRSSWSNSTSIQGLSEEGQPVTWQFISELSCTNIIENQQFDDSYLKFNLLVKYYKSNKVLFTNFIVNINSNKICQNEQDQVSTIITYNNIENLVFIDNEQTDFYKLVDDIGLFSNNFWGNRIDYSPARPRYCSNNTSSPASSSVSRPFVRGTFPEFKINFNAPITNIDQAIFDGCSVTIENP
jgi:hypothetical protein